MKIEKLKVTVTGALWRLREFEIEAIDVIDKWKQKDDDSEGWVEVTDFIVSPDNILDVYIYLGAPNRNSYRVSLTGRASDGGNNYDIKFSDDYEVERNGRLRINISKDMSSITTRVV